MNRNRSIVLASIVCAALGSTASADWIPGQPIAVIGTTFTLGDPSESFWGTQVSGDFHPIGGQTSYVDPLYGASFPILVSSTLGSPQDLSIVIDFSNYVFLEIGWYEVVFPDLKPNGGILSVDATSGAASTDGVSVTWTGNVQDGFDDVKIFISQVPTPGAISLLGLAGISARRRRAR
ncbi:MAG: hypothetical protein FJ253_01175 [Phycisphaerae bacterium]|nr:hypothetical protein [Phycisphaerae bacterium]